MCHQFGQNINLKTPLRVFNSFVHTRWESFPNWWDAKTDYDFIDLEGAVSFFIY